MRQNLQNTQRCGDSFKHCCSSATVDACVIYLSVLALPATYQFTSLIEKDWTSVQLMSWHTDNYFRELIKTVLKMANLTPKQAIFDFQFQWPISQWQSHSPKSLIAKVFFSSPCSIFATWKRRKLQCNANSLAAPSGSINNSVLSLPILEPHKMCIYDAV